MADNEKLYTIPLRKAYRKPRGKRANYAMKLVIDFLRTHTKADEVKIGSKLNEEIWKKGAEKPPRRIRVKAVVDEKTAKAELMGYEFREFKAAPKSEKKGGKEKLLERLGQKAMKKEQEAEKIEGDKGVPAGAKKEQEKQIEIKKKAESEEDSDIVSKEGQTP